MRFMTLYTADQAPSGPPDAEHMAVMNKLVDEQNSANAALSLYSNIRSELRQLEVRDQHTGQRRAEHHAERAAQAVERPRGRDLLALDQAWQQRGE